jgi:cell division protein FtsI/penicillin-binding protein 2
MRLSVQRGDASEFRRRYQWMVLAVLAAFFVLTARAAQLQIFERDLHRAQARR